MAKIVATIGSADVLLKVMEALTKLGVQFTTSNDEGEIQHPSTVVTEALTNGRNKVTYKATNLPVHIARGTTFTVYRFFQKNPGTSTAAAVQGTGLKRKAVEMCIQRLRTLKALESTPVSREPLNGIEVDAVEF